MALNLEILRSRLKEVFSGESQETVAGRLNMTQGNVSKLLSGSQTPTLETVYHVAEAYDVSADWLLGLSEQKRAMKSESLVTYGISTEVLCSLSRVGALDMHDGQNQSRIVMSLIDPLLEKLVRKSNTLSRTDWELYKAWKESKLALFMDKTVVSSGSWQNSNIQNLMYEASTESHYLEVYKYLEEAEAEIEEMMADNPGPFER